MDWRQSIERGANVLKPFGIAAALVAISVASILFMPGRGAAAILGILWGMILTYFIIFKTVESSQLALFWALAAITGDAAYAKLNDQTPVTLANMLIKTVDGFIKLADPLIMGLGFSSTDPRAKVNAVAPDFIWALILTYLVAMSARFAMTPRGGR